MMEIRQLNTFVTIIKTMSFTQAAIELNYAQSTITSQIQALEEELGTMLFERLGKQIKLTKDGELLYTYAGKILTLSAEAKAVISSSLSPKGTLTIGTAESLCTHRLPEVLKTFRERYPNIEINFNLDACPDYRTHLKKNTIDIMFFLDVPLKEPDLITHVLFEEPMIVIAAPNHPLAKQSKVTPYDINNQALILTNLGCSYRRIFESILAQAGAKPSSTLAFSSNEVIKKFVMDGWGIGFLPEITVKSELLSRQLIALPWTGTPFNIKTQIIYHKDKWISPALRAFIDIIMETFAK
jgi:DNA-binding transcriptional LysR family regulator